MDVNSLLRRHEALEARRSTWERTWERIAELVLPRSDDFGRKYSPGDNRSRRQYDAFPMAALDKFAAGIEAALMPRTTLWHVLSTGDDKLDEDHEVRVYMEALNQELWDRRYSPRANFASQAHEKRLSLGAFGTGCMLVEPRQGGGARYKTIHLGEIFIAENADGMIDTTHRAFCLTARQAIQTFKEATPDKIVKDYNAGKIDKEFDFLHCVAPNEDYDAGRIDNLPFSSFYVCKDSKEVVRQDGYHEMPYIVSRYSVSSREIYGRSPAGQMLPDIAMLNEMRRTTIEAANMAVDPPVLLMDDDISEFDLTPGARNYGGLDLNGNEKARPWNQNVDVRLGLEMIQDTRAQIDDGFMGVYFRVLLENPNMTATQAMLIAQQQGQMTAPVIGRLQTEWLGPLIRRESGILYRQGLHPVMPEKLKKHIEKKQDGLQIDYQSPMTRAARSEEAVGILRAFESLAPLAQIDPSVYDIFDNDEVARVIADVNGVPARALKSKEKREQELSEQEAQAQLGNVLQAAPIAAQTAKTLAEAQSLSQQPSPVGV